MHFPSLSVGASLIVAFASMAAADGTAYNNALAKACVKSHSTPEEVSNVFQDIECVLAAIGTSTEDTGRPIDIFLTRWFEKAGPGNGTPQSGNLPPASDEVLAHLAYDQVGADVTEQSWVDAYYGLVLCGVEGK